MNKKQIYFKSDFTVILASEAQWGGCPFRLSFYTASPSRAFVASFDGENWENCRLLDDGRLEVAINQKDGTMQTLMGIGTLMCAPEFYLDNDAFRDHVCNEFVKPFAPVFVDTDGTEYNVILDLNGSSTLVTIGTLPAFYQKGDKGDKGDKGQDGSCKFEDLTPEQIESLRGPQGVQGETGPAGPQGEQGVRGADGKKGEPFHYEDFTPEQLEGLRGPKGDKGDKGDTGKDLSEELTALDLKVGEINATLGQYAERASVLLEVGMDNMAIDAATGKPITKNGWAISKPFTIQRGNEYLVKVGQTDGSVWAAAEQSIYEWDEVIVDEETGEETIVHHTDISYSKKVQLNAGAELPLDGYLRILGMPNDFDIVVSYHKASADTTIKVRRDGLTANICTQVGNQEAEQSDALNELDERASEAANAKRDFVDVVNDYLANGYPTTLYGHGTPSASVLPLNLPKHLPWSGTPEHIAQRYVNVDATSGGLYYAKPTLNTFGYITAYTWAQA